MPNLKQPKRNSDNKKKNTSESNRNSLKDTNKNRGKKMSDPEYAKLVKYCGVEMADALKHAVHYGDLEPWLKQRKKERECKQ